MRTEMRALISLLISLLLALSCGCATSLHEPIPNDDIPIKDVWDNHFNGSNSNQPNSNNGDSDDSRLGNIRKLIQETKATDSSRDYVHKEPGKYVRDATTELHTVFPRKPNKELLIYKHPHLAGPNRIPVPGYITSIPMYPNIRYALPGQRTQ